MAAPTHIGPPRRVQEYATQAVEYVRRAVGLELAYDSDTLPLLDHYLRSVPGDQPATVELIALTAGAYFGEVVRRRLGGRWDTSDEDVMEWRVVLTTGVHFSPIGFVAAAIVRDELDDLDTSLDAPPRMLPYVEQTLARMGEVTEDDYYSLCGRLDTLEHVHEVLVAVAAKLLGKQNGDDPDAGDGAEPGSEVDAEGDDEDDDEDEDAEDDDVPGPVSLN
jgi:hypothetical protein